MHSPSSSISVTASLKQAASLHPKQPAFHLSVNQSISYGEALDRVSRLASGLKKNGLKEEDPVAVMSLNSHKYAESFYAVPWAGGVIVPVNIRWSPAEILFSFIDCAVAYVMVDDVFAQMIPAMKAKLKTVKHYVYMGDGEIPQGCIGVEDMIANSEPTEDAARGGDETYGIFYTGGTTGQSKGVMLTHTNIIINAMGMAMQMRYSPKSNYLHCAPMFHLADCSQTFAVVMSAGSHSFIPKFTPKDFCEAVQLFKPDFSVLVPVMINFVVHFPEAKNYDLSSLRYVLYGASPMSEALLLKAMEVFKNSEWIQGYGMTETSPIITMNGTDVHKPGHPKMSATGVPVCWAETKILDEYDNEVPRGTVGEVCTRGPHVMKGYFNRPDLTANALRNGWMHTGDGGYMDEDGYIYLVDRLKDMIVTGGENVYSTEVENVVMSFPGVQAVAVIGTPHEEYGELVTAVVMPKEGHSIDETKLVAHCKEAIASYKCPKKVIIRDQLPISGANKILKHEIRKEFWGEDQHRYASDQAKTTYQ